MEPSREEESQPSYSSSSLFPLFPLPSSSSAASTTASASTAAASTTAAASDPPQWLSNPSFTFDVSSLNLPSSSAAAGASAPPDSDTDSGGAPPHPAPPKYDLVGPTSSSEDGDDRRESRRKDKKKRKRRREKESSGHGSSRKSGVRSWSESKPSSKDYYFDAKGDHDNLAYGSLYRMDVARYKPHNHTEFSGLHFQVFRCRPSDSSMDIDGDLDVIDSKLRSGGRYYSMKYTALERHKGFKHVKIVDKMSPTVPGPGEEYIPLVELKVSHGNGSNLSSRQLELEESWEDELLRRTRELNKMSRDFPHDEKVWVAFAEFQDKVASTQPQKAARLQTLEKKISILEKAVELNPENEELLLYLLKSCQERDSGGALMERWEKVLMQHSDSVKLWKEFLLVCQGEFSLFKVSDMRKTYANAIQAISSARDKLCRQGHQPANLQSTDPSFVQLELGLVDIFISLCRFEWQTGYQELSTGLFQAEIEYSLFYPSLLLSSQSKRRLFEHFWNTAGARLGEDGALGWSTWLESEEQNRNDTYSEEILQETESGGWTGWSDRPSKKIANAELTVKSEEHTADQENSEVNLDNEDNPQEDDIESLLKKLGIDANDEPHSEVKDSETWNRWSMEELSRDSNQWMPVRGHSGNYGKSGTSPSEDHQDVEGNEELSKVILFEDVNDYLFSLFSEQARFSLVSQFIDFYGGKISRWTCTNSSSWADRLLSLDKVPDSIIEDLKVVLEGVDRTHSSGIHPQLEVLVGSTNDLPRKTNMMKFLRNAILLLLNVFPRNHSLEDSLLVAEELFKTKMNSSACSVNPSRSLAKRLLKIDRQDLLLCGVYARSEASYGNIDIARKIFDMALSSTDGLPVGIKEYLPLLYLWYAEMEMAIHSSGSSYEQSLQRAVHILSCLGGNIKYTPFKCQLPGLQILRARQGFKEQTKGLQSSWAHGDVKEHSVALVCAYSLFEVLTTGLSAGIEVIEETFSMTLPERRIQSLQLESLWIYCIAMLQKHHKQLSFSRLWPSVLKGLKLYPCNPKTFSFMLEVTSLFSLTHKVRCMFDECSQRKPSVLTWLFALSFELTRSGSQHRIHGLFERALANDKLQKSVLLWRCYLAYEVEVECNPSAAKRIFFRAIHACPWSKRLWLDGFQKLSSTLSVKELSDLQEVMQEKELNLRTDIYEILLQDESER